MEIKSKTCRRASCQSDNSWSASELFRVCVCVCVCVSMEGVDGTTVDE